MERAYVGTRCMKWIVYDLFPCINVKVEAVVLLRCSCYILAVVSSQ